MHESPKPGGAELRSCLSSSLRTPNPACHHRRIRTLHVYVIRWIDFCRGVALRCGAPNIDHRHRNKLQFDRTRFCRTSPGTVRLYGAVEISSCKSHRHFSPHRRTVKSSCTAARSAALAINFPAMVEAMSIPAEVLKLRLHSRRLPEQLDFPSCPEKVCFMENLMT
jgi:hypothetical protein